MNGKSPAQQTRLSFNKLHNIIGSFFVVDAPSRANTRCLLFVSLFMGRFCIKIPPKLGATFPTESILTRAGNNQKCANTIKYSPGVSNIHPE